MSTYIGRVSERCGAFSPHSHLPELALAYFLVGVREWVLAMQLAKELLERRLNLSVLGVRRSDIQRDRR